jgi:hypothetical protein
MGKSGNFMSLSRISLVNLTVCVFVFVGFGSLFVFFSRAATLTADINGDGSVNILDLSLLLSSYNQTSGACLTAQNATCDLNADNSVNIFDLSILLTNYGTTSVMLNPPTISLNSSTKTISWSTVANATSYKGSIASAPVSNAIRTILDTPDLGNVTSWTPPADCGKTRYYNIAAKNSTTEQWSSQEVSITWPACPVLTSSATLLKINCQPLWVSGSQMIFNMRQANNLWDVFMGDTNCGNATPLLPAFNGHRGGTDVTPDGRYVLLETDYGNPPGQDIAEPGKGFKNDLELLDRNTGIKTRLTTGRMGTIWGRLHPNGSKITWSQMYQDPIASGDLWNYALGLWEVHVADLTPQGSIANEKSWKRSDDQGFYETYGWYNDKIMFASDAGVQPKSPWGYWLGSQDWLIPDSLPAGNSATRVSQPSPDPFGGLENNYHEFMFLAPSGMFSDDPGPWILTSVVRDSNGGMDLWRMKTDGSSATKVTYFNGKNVNFAWQQVPGYPPPIYSVVGGLAFDQSNPKLIYAGVALDANAKDITAFRIQLP